MKAQSLIMNAINNLESKLAAERKRIAALEDLEQMYTDKLSLFTARLSNARKAEEGLEISLDAAKKAHTAIPAIEHPATALNPITPKDIEMILTEAAHEYGLTSQQLRKECKQRKYVAARRIAAEKLQKLGMTLYDIGQCLGGIHHTTVLNLIRNNPFPDDVKPAAEPGGPQ